MARSSVPMRANGRAGRPVMSLGPQMPRIKPFSEMGAGGVPVFGGYITSIERNSEWAGQWKYKTASEIATNVSIVAAGIHYFLNLIARPKWKVVPASDDNPEATRLAEFVEEVLDDMETPWSRIVRRGGMYRFHGFSIQEWTAIKRKDGQIGLKDVEQRSQYTIEQWSVEPDGTLSGVTQRSPQTSQLLPIPRGKMYYLVEDTLSDSPEGVGVLRHMAEPWNRLKKFLELETLAFERDLRGTPIGRAPITAIREAVRAGRLTQADADALLNGMRNFVQQQVKSQDTGVVLDSAPYQSVSSDGPKVSGIQQWGLELLQGSPSGMIELAQAIDRVQREMARVGGFEHLMLGDGAGGANRALSEDKSKNMFLTANSVLVNMADAATNDIIKPLWTLNGFDEDLLPYFQPEDVTFKDVDQIVKALSGMAAAGAMLHPRDPAIDDVRDLLGITRTPEELQAELEADAANMDGEVPEEELEVSDEFSLDDPRGDQPLEDEEETEKVLKGRFDEGKIRRAPRGSGKGGQFTSKPGGSSSGKQSIPKEFLIRVEVEPDVWITLDKRKLGGKTPREAAIEEAVKEGLMEAPKDDISDESVIVKPGPLSEQWDEALRAIPEAHRQVLGQKGLELRSSVVVHNKNGDEVLGLSTIDRKERRLILEVAEQALGRKSMDPVGTAVHELGHALDNASNRELSEELASYVDAGAKKMTDAQRNYAKHYLSSDGEKFAELYRLAYSPGKGAFGLTRETAEAMFAEALKEIRRI